ncbi:MAG: hypothetical protein UX63_C0025G0002 [Microgenomates group bacterium GW2011_GWB1_46_7]|uniref:Nucleoside 2-deoxyribosyltransferase n=1 Tax=Candidatus Collierbacteria bacterium RIFOXYA2_FULL_46_10 TaxID=1817726 RepID=A0A1F5F794_9BACT|nr:MAG: hypothetical protein UX63_C0025G0002 [Microgenomates group bacterium GW2011_GWB1_46_7]OGD75234.1 MAG: hypothetical protein A2228_02365 [Candidatus Collierbacteria bacterium RIFOXYA2_FULL_46_10]
MKVTFIASHSQAEELKDFYKRIHAVLEDRGYTIYTGTLFDKKRADSYLVDQKKREEWYKDSITKIRESDIVVAETSYPSTANVGHELTYALDLGKPVVALYKSGRDPFFLRGRVDEKLTILPYTTFDLEQVLNNAFDYALSAQDVRFNFFISPQIGSYLDWISRKKKLPRAVYLRRLIEDDMKLNKDYEEA